MHRGRLSGIVIHCDDIEAGSRFRVSLPEAAGFPEGVREWRPQR
jgi:hypothetical protein